MRMFPNCSNQSRLFGLQIVHMGNNYFTIRIDENYYNCITHFLGAKGFIKYGSEVNNGFLSLEI